MSIGKSVNSDFAFKGSLRFHDKNYVSTQTSLNLLLTIKDFSIPRIRSTLDGTARWEDSSKKKIEIGNSEEIEENF